MFFQFLREDLLRVESEQVASSGWWSESETGIPTWKRCRLCPHPADSSASYVCSTWQPAGIFSGWGEPTLWTGAGLLSWSNLRSKYYTLSPDAMMRTLKKEKAQYCIVCKQLEIADILLVPLRNVIVSWVWLGLFLQAFSTHKLARSGSDDQVILPHTDTCHGHAECARMHSFCVSMVQLL